MEQVQHCTDLPLQVAFPVHTEQGKVGVRIGMNVAAHQEKKKNEKTGKREIVKEEIKQSIDFKKGCVLLFYGRSASSPRKFKSRKGVPEISGTVGEVNSYFDPTQAGSRTAPPR